jgi:hypothetical protein
MFSACYGSAGNGTPPHISAKLFKQLTNVDMNMPFKNSNKIK